MTKSPPAVISLLLILFAPWVGASDLEEIQRRGTLVMISFPHQESHFVRPDLKALRRSGKPLGELRDAAAYRGIDVEILRAFAARLGVGLEVHPILTSYADLIPALERGEGDLIASSLTITEARAEQVDFSMPYLNSWVVVAARPNSGLLTVDDLAGRRAAVMRGSSQLEFLRQLEIPGLELVLTDYTLENALALEEGRADFALFDSWHAPGEAVQQGMTGIEVAFRLRPFDYGFALPRGSDLRGALDRFLVELEASGEIERIVADHSR